MSHTAPRFRILTDACRRWLWRFVRPVRLREISSSLWRWDTSPYAKSIAEKIKTADDYDAVILTVMIDRKDYPEVRRRLWPNAKGQTAAPNHPNQ